MQYLEKMVLDLEEEEKKIEYMKTGRGRGPHQVRKYISRPSKKKSCIATVYPCLLLQEGPCHDSLSIVILLAALDYRDSAEDMDKGRVNTFKLC